MYVEFSTLVRIVGCSIYIQDEAKKRIHVSNGTIAGDGDWVGDRLCIREGLLKHISLFFHFEFDFKEFEFDGWIP